MLLPALLGIIGAVVGFIIAKALEKSKGNKLLNSTKKEAASIVKEAKIDAESLKRDKILHAKEKFIEFTRNIAHTNGRRHEGYLRNS